MGILYEGLNGAFSGKVGPVIGYRWKNRSCIRAYNNKICYPNTQQQQHERSWFVGMVRFAAHAKDAIQLGLRQQAEEKGMTEGNYFISRNKMHFHRIEDGTVEVDYNKLTIAEGAGNNVLFHNPIFRENETLEVNFEKNVIFGKTGSDDQVYLYIYSPELEEGWLTAPTARRNKCIKFQLPEHWSGSIVHIYGFVIEKDGRTSTSSYVGVGKVNHTEERGVYIPINKSWNDFVEMATHANGESKNEAQETRDNIEKSRDEAQRNRVEEIVHHIDIFAPPDTTPPE